MLCRQLRTDLGRGGNRSAGPYSSGWDGEGMELSLGRFEGIEGAGGFVGTGGGGCGGGSGAGQRRGTGLVPREIDVAHAVGAVRGR